METEPNFALEISFLKDYPAIAGLDEVGRGAIAGPIVAGAVVFRDYSAIKKSLKGINDSKKLSPLKRIELDRVIRNCALDTSIGMAESWEIDLFGIGAANILVFKRALDGLKKCDLAIIDGRKFRGLNYKFKCFEKGDSRSISVAAASIIAKVYRDGLMEEIHEKIFRYDFASNKGYGSKRHYEALQKYGPCPFHRKSFLKKFHDFIDQKQLF